MSDEGVQGDPMSAIEMAEAMRNLASGAKSFYDGLREEGFSTSDSIRLTAAWISGLAGSQSK